MFRGHFEGASSRPHQLLARAIFTPSLLESQQRFASLGLFKLEPSLFVAALEAGENIETVIEKLANPDLAPQVREWLLNPASRPAGSTSLGRFYESLQRNQGGFTAPSTPLIEEVKFVEPRPILAPRPPLLGLEGLLDDFLSLSSPRTPLSESASSLDASDASDDDGVDDANDDEPLVPRVEDWWLPMAEDMPPTNSAESEPFYTVYFRVMGARLLASRLGPIKRNHIKERVLLKKIDRFIEAHTLLFHWVHQRGPLTLTQEHLVRLYRPLGVANMYACDRPLIRVERTAHVLRERPLVILKRRWPALFWEPECVPLDQLAKLGTCPRIVQPNDGGWVGWAPFIEGVSLTTHRLYYGVVWVLNQCMRKLRKAMTTETERYALWVYYVSWVDLFHYCLTTQTIPRIDDAFLRLPPGSAQQPRTGHMSYGDTASPWALYGTCDTRTFCAGDLPDFFHVLVTLPLWGEQQTPPYFLGKLYQKALPFAGARRHIVKLAIKCILDHPVFWRVFSRLMWVMLANLYPGDLAGPYDALGMRSLLRIKELCENRDLLIGTLIAYQPGMGEIWIREELKTSRDPFIQMLRPNANRPKTGVAANGGPLIVATMFRMHILYMGHFNPTYVEQARRLIDWDYHKAEAVRLSSLIRQRGLFAQDAFAQARAELSKTVKSPHSHVHRIRRHSIPMMVQEKMNDVLEKLILRNRQIYSKDAAVLQDILSTPEQPQQVKRFFAETKLGEKAAEAGIDPAVITPDILALARACAERSVEEYNQLLDLGVKSAIQNALLHVMPHDRLTKPTFAALLMKPEYGAISGKAVEIMWRLVLVAADKAAPKDFARYIGALDHHDFLVATYYFNVVAQLDNIHFVALDEETRAQTHETMVQKRYQQDPDDEHDESMYEIAISLCCNRICTIMGQDKFGSRRVALDLERGQLVCVHSKPPRSFPLPGNNQDIVIDDGADANDGDDDDAHEDAEDGDDDDDDDGGGEEEDAGDTDHPVLHQVEAMAQEDEMDEEALLGLEGGGDLLGDAIAMGGKGTRKARLMQDRKQIRNQRKQFNKVPCGQPVLVISLQGRALLWGNQLDKRVQIMFCPTCGGLHMYTVFGWSMLESDRQRYRCAECMRSELTHVPYIVCAYCGKNATPECVLNVMCPLTDTTYNGNRAFDPLSAAGAGSTMQELYFCEPHYHVAKRHTRNMNKNDLWAVLKYVHEARVLRRARGQMNSGRIGYGSK